MAENSQSTRKKRRIRESTETIRERGVRADATKSTAQKRGPVRRMLHWFFGLIIWKPFKVTGRFLGKYLIPPYFKNSWRELRFVTWPSRTQSRQLTFAVMVFAVVFGVIIAIVDYGLDKAFKALILNQ